MSCIRFFLTAGLVMVVELGLPLFSRATELSTSGSYTGQTEMNGTIGMYTHDEQAIKQLIEKYRLGYQLEDLSALAEIYADFTPALSKAMFRYHQTVKNLVVKVQDVYIRVEGPEAVATFTRQDSFIDARSGRPVQLQVKLTKKFVQQDGLWKMLASAEVR